MTGFRFIPNPAGVKAIAHGDGVRRLVERNANHVRDLARADAPFGFGGYQRHIEREPAELTRDGWRADVVADSPFWHLVEFGSVNNPAHHVLERAVLAAGLDFEAS